MMNVWQHWQDNLAGKPVQFNEGNPQPGFYRWPHRAGYGGPKTFEPVAYWPGENGEINCRKGQENLSPQGGADIWTFVCRYPVSEEVYREVAEKGGRWPDEAPGVPMGAGDNQAPEDNSYEGLKAKIEELARDAQALMDGPPIETQDAADQVANLADAMAKLAQKAEAGRKEEKKPIDEAAAEVQKKWVPIVLLAETYKNLKYKCLTPWLQRLDAERKKEAAATVASGETVADTARPRAGTRGRAMTLKRTKTAKITDYSACLAFFANSEAVKSVIQDLANKGIRAGISIPGTEVEETESAV